MVVKNLSTNQFIDFILMNLVYLEPGDLDITWSKDRYTVSLSKHIGSDVIVVSSIPLSKGYAWKLYHTVKSTMLDELPF